MRILIISSVPTHPVTAGNRKAILNQVELFKSMGNDVSFVYVQENAFLSKGVDDITEMRQYWGNKLFIFQVSRFEHGIHLLKQRLRRFLQNSVTQVDDYYPWQLSRYIRDLHRKEKFDCCIVNYYFLSKALLIENIPLRGLYTHDYFAYKSLLVGNRSVGYSTDAHQEAIAMQRSPHIFALNADEAIYFNKLSPKSRVYNTYSHYSFIETECVGNKNILFLSGDNNFNISGLNWFLDSIYPKILKEIPDIHLIIGGGICRKLAGRNIPNCTLVGFIFNANDFYAKGDIVINPTYQGTGLKIKTFEAISYGKVVVAHPHSVAGIFNRDNAPVYASEIPEDWVEFLKTTIGNKVSILRIKNNDCKYISDMNAHVEQEYNRFFSSQIKDK